MQTINLWWCISILACLAGRCRNSQTKTCESESYISGNSAVKAGWCNQTAALQTTWHSKEVCYSYQIYRSYPKSGHLEKNSCLPVIKLPTVELLCELYVRNFTLYEHSKKKSVQGASEAMNSNKLQNQIPARDEKWVPDVYLCPDYDQADVDNVIFRDLGKLHSKLCAWFHIHLMSLYTLTKRIVNYTTEFLWWWRPTPWAFTRFWVRGMKAIPSIQFIENKINERELYETEFHLA